MTRFLLSLLLMAFYSNSAKAEIPDGFSFQLSGQTVETHGSVIAERGGTSSYSAYLGYGLTFYKEGHDSIRLNLGGQPIKSSDETLIYAIDSTLSFLFSPFKQNNWVFDVRFGPQFWAEQDGVQLFRAVGASYKFGKTLNAVTLLLGQSDYDDLMYTQLRAGVDFVF